MPQGIYTSVWASEIAENIFPDDSFVVCSKDDNQWVINETVVLPQSGSKPASTRNRSVFPAIITERVDIVIEYALQEFSTDPQRLRNMDALKVSYLKRKDMLGDHSSILQEDVANYLMYVWSANQAANIALTTGATRDATAVGATGQRKGITYKDIKAAMVKMDVQNIPRKGRKILMNPMMLSDLLDDPKLTSRDWVDANNSLQDGLIGRLNGFDVFVRSTIAAYADNATLPKDPLAVAAATDDAGCLLWHPNFVRRALGTTTVLLNEQRAEHYGDLMSCETRAGGSAAYFNRRGTFTIKEAK